MESLKKIKLLIVSWDEKEFKTYLTVALGITLIMLLFFISFYFRQINSLKRQISYTSEQREEVKKIIEAYEIVDIQEKKIAALLEEKGNFKIRDIDEVFKKLNMTPQTSVTSQAEKDETYREVTLKATFDSLSMKQVCSLLEALQDNKLVYTKELEITRAKSAQAINVALTIATLQKKSILPEIAE